MKTKTALDMTSGPIFRKLFLYAYPLMLRSIINTLYSTVDKVVAGKCISTAAMAAIGASAHPINLVANMISGLSVGVSVCCGNYIGGRKQRELRECMHTALLLGFLGGCLVGLLGAVTADPLLTAMDTPASIYRDAKVYMMIRFAAYPLALMNTFCCCIMNANGDTKTPTVVSLISGAVNVVFNLLFVLGFHMDIAGLGWATFLSHLTDTVILIWILFYGKNGYKMRWQELKLWWSHMRSVFSVGIPSGMSTTVFAISNIILQSTVNSFGETVVAGNTAAGSCSNYVNIVLASFASACVCATAQCYGAYNFERIKLVVKRSLQGSLCLSFGMALVITIFARPMMGVFTDKAEVVTAGIPLLMFNCWGFLIHAFGNIYGSALRGIRKSSISMVINLVGGCIPKVIWVLTVMRVVHTPIALYCVYPVSWIISSSMMFFAYRKNFKQLVLQNT